MSHLDSIKRPGSPKVRSVYWKNCTVCQYMKKNPTFRLRVMQSTYFKPEGHESLSTVIHDFGDPFKVSLAFAHMGRHQANDLLTARKRYSVVKPLSKQTPVMPLDAVEGEVVSKSAHETALDEFIQVGHDKLTRGEMTISATNFLAAIKIKSDNEKSTKDRRLEAIKTFFGSGGAGGKNETKTV